MQTIPTEYDPTQAATTNVPVADATQITPTGADSGIITHANDAITQNVTPESTVKNQMEGLLSENSQYMQLAKQGAKEESASRGLLNSSIAAGAGQRAAIQSALPIAQQDAQTYNNQSLVNQQYQNQFGAAENQANFASDMADQDVARKEQLAITQTNLNKDAAQYAAELDMLKQNDQQAYQTFLTNLNTSNQQEIMAAEAHIKTQLAQVQQDYAVQLEKIKTNLAIQGNLDSQVGQLYADNIKSIGTILASPDITSGDKNNLVSIMMSNMNTMSNYLNAIKGDSIVAQQTAEGETVNNQIDLYQPGV